MLRQISHQVAAPHCRRGGQSADADRPPRWLERSEKEADERRFTAAVGSDQTQRGAFLDLQIHVLEDRL